MVAVGSCLGSQVGAGEVYDRVDLESSRAGGPRRRRCRQLISSRQDDVDILTDPRITELAGGPNVDDSETLFASAFYVDVVSCNRYAVHRTCEGGSPVIA